MTQPTPPTNAAAPGESRSAFPGALPGRAEADFPQPGPVTVTTDTHWTLSAEALWANGSELHRLRNAINLLRAQGAPENALVSYDSDLSRLVAVWGQS